MVSVLERVETRCLLSAYVIDFDWLVHTQCDYNSCASWVRIYWIRVDVAPLEVSYRCIMVVETHEILSRLGGPNENLRIILSAACKKRTLGIPFDALYDVVVSLPNFQRQFIARVINGPQIYVLATCCSQLTVILPGYVDDLATLLEFIERLFLYGIGVPDQNICLISTWSYKCIVFVPAWVY